MQLTSQSFKHNGAIPKRHTGEGEDLSPPLVIADLPAGMVTLALIVDDPDAPMGTFDHWIVWNLANGDLPEGVQAEHEGTNHFGETSYKGPMPPRGPVHRYFFKAYALDTALDLADGSTKEELLEAMEGHILAKAELIGTYQR